MYGLVIDTSSPSAILGLLEDSEVKKMVVLEGAKKLSETLFPTLATFCDLEEISYIAIGIGPGSYMGVRTGATIAKTLAFAKNIPLVEFSSPLAFIPPDQKGTFTYVGDAKMGQLYLITGEVKDGKIHELSSPILIDKEAPISKKDFTVGVGYLLPEPNLKWVAPYVYQRFIQKTTTQPSHLELCYIR